MLALGKNRKTKDGNKKVFLKYFWDKHHIMTRHSSLYSTTISLHPTFAQDSQIINATRNNLGMIYVEKDMNSGPPLLSRFNMWCVLRIFITNNIVLQRQIIAPNHKLPPATKQPLLLRLHLCPTNPSNPSRVLGKVVTQVCELHRNSCTCLLPNCNFHWEDNVWRGAPLSAAEMNHLKSGEKFGPTCFLPSPLRPSIQLFPSPVLQLANGEKEAHSKFLRPIFRFPLPDYECCSCNFRMTQLHAFSTFSLFLGQWLTKEIMQQRLGKIGLVSNWKKYEWHF